jgi:hypothetical protein
MAANCTGPTQAEIDAEKAETAAAATKLTAIGVSADQTGGDDENLGGSSTFDYTLVIARDRDDTKVTITDNNAALQGEDDPKFATVMDLDMANGFDGTMNRRVNSDDEDGLVEEVTVVRTDIDAPKATSFAMVDGQELDVSTNTRNDDPNDTFEAFAIDENDVDVRGLIMSDAFTAGTAAVLTFDDNDTTTDDMDEAFETAGTYNGAMGTYRCNGDADCTVTLDADGMITGMSDGWIFTPAMGATSDVADASFLSYGIWLKRTTKDGETTYNEVEAFTQAMGIPATVGTDIAGVVGSATYMGNSTGVYVKNVYEPSTSGEQEIVSATSGLYTAAVTLTANFGGDDVAANDKFTIGGTVTDFDLEKDGRADWKVKLELADFSGRDGMGPGKEGPGSNIVNTFGGKATGDSTADEGSWSGTFYGTAGGEVDHDMDAATDEINVAPSAVLGELNAYFTDGAVLGGFGANKK